MQFSRFYFPASTSRKTLSYERGTTLIEMLLYMGIVSVLLVGVGTVSMSALDARSKARAVGAVFSGGSTALAGVRAAIESNTVVRTPFMGASSSSLALAASVASTGTTRLFLADSSLVLVESNGNQLALTPRDVRVDALTFSAHGSGGTSTSVAVHLTLSASSSSMWKSFQYSETFTSAFVVGTYQ